MNGSVFRKERNPLADAIQIADRLIEAFTKGKILVSQGGSGSIKNKWTFMPVKSDAHVVY